MNTHAAETFWTTFNHRSNDLESAIQDENAESLTAIVDELADLLWQVDDRLNINIHGPDPFRIGILALPGAESAANELIQLKRLPANWETGVGLPNDELVLIRVEDETGDLLEVAYEDLHAIVLPPKEGEVTILLALDKDFDPRGDRAHLYQAVAEHAVNTLLGGAPPNLVNSVLVPLSSIDADLVQPIFTLREQWLNVVAAGGMPEAHSNQ